MRVCFFDIDGTLIASGGAGQRAFADVFRKLYGVEQLSGDISFAGRSDRAIALDLMQAHGVEPSEKNWLDFQGNYIGKLPQWLKQCDGTVLPGVVNLIEQLQQTDGVEIGLLTGNVVRGAQAKLTHYGLWQHFSFGGYGDQHCERSEIAKSAVMAARQHLNVSHQPDERCVVIGDTVHDIRCARAIGAYAVAVPTGFTPMDELRQEEPDLAIETLEEAATLVDWLTA